MTQFGTLTITFIPDPFTFKRHTTQIRFINTEDNMNMIRALISNCYIKDGVVSSISYELDKVEVNKPDFSKPPLPIQAKPSLGLAGQADLSILMQNDQPRNNT